MITYFVDTNIFVYRLDAAAGEKQRRAHEVLERLWREHSGRTSFQVLHEAYSVATRKLRVTPEDARAAVRDLLAWHPIVQDGALLERAWHAQDRYGLSFWDAAIVAAAQRAACDYLLTEDLQDGQDLGGVRVVNPFVSQAGAVI